MLFNAILLCNCNYNFDMFNICVYVTFCNFYKKLRVDVTKKFRFFFCVMITYFTFFLNIDNVRKALCENQYSFCIWFVNDNYGLFLNNFVNNFIEING